MFDRESRPSKAPSPNPNRASQGPEKAPSPNPLWFQLSAGALSRMPAAREEFEHEEEAHGAPPRPADPGARHEGSTAPPAVHSTLQSPGTPLDAATRRMFEPAFEQDFSDVRVHDDNQADTSTKSVAATAFTVGSHIAFRRGAFSPTTTAGRSLLAHELAHVVQRDGALPRAAGTGLDVAPANDPSEREADRMARAAVSRFGGAPGGLLSTALSPHASVSVSAPASAGVVRRQPDEAAPAQQPGTAVPLSTRLAGGTLTVPQGRGGSTGSARSSEFFIPADTTVNISANASYLSPSENRSDWSVTLFRSTMFGADEQVGARETRRVGDPVNVSRHVPGAWTSDYFLLFRNASNYEAISVSFSVVIP